MLKSNQKIRFGLIKYMFKIEHGYIQRSVQAIIIMMIKKNVYTSRPFKRVIKIVCSENLRPFHHSATSSFI